jgi:putative membrane protein
MKRTGLLAIAFAAAVAVGCSNDTDRTANTAGDGSAVGTSGSKVSAGDRDFVRDVATMNMGELDLARLAADKAADANTRKFAQMMLDDHPAAGDKLKAFAAQRSIELPAQTDEKHRDLHEKLAAKTGLEFDKAYADAMVEGHQDFVNKLESRIDTKTLSDWKTFRESQATGKREKTTTEAAAVTAEQSDNPDTQALNQWAAETYPVAFAHLEAAKELQAGLKKRATN